MNLTIAALQLTARPADVEGNLDRLEQVMADLPPSTGLAVTPELYTTGYDLDMLEHRGRELADEADGPTVSRLAEMAGRSNLTLVAGFLERSNGELFDSAVVVDGTADPIVYRKTHLYPAEQALFAPGTELVVATSGSPRLGLMICFEHAFPEVATTLALGGADILVIPSAVPHGYEHVLGLRTRARAQDNQVFAIGCNMSGPFCGRSLIVDPRGEVIAQAGEDDQTLVVTIELEAVDTERRREPSLRLRRPELYR